MARGVALRGQDIAAGLHEFCAMFGILLEVHLLRTLDPAVRA